MRYRHWVVEHQGNFDQLYSPVAIKKMRNTLEELVSGHEQMTFVSISQSNQEKRPVSEYKSYKETSDKRKSEERFTTSNQDEIEDQQTRQISDNLQKLKLFKLKKVKS